MRVKRLFVIVFVLMIALLTTHCRPTPPTAGEPAPVAAETAHSGDLIRVAFVYNGPVGDLGWNYDHDQGRLEMDEALGDKIKTTYIENVPEDPEAERVIRDLAHKGYDLIVTTSFGYMDATTIVAQEFPDTWFVHVSGYQVASNVSTIFGRMYQPRYLSGMVAGSTTSTSYIGYVAAFPTPEVIRGINAFSLGVRRVNPGASVHVVWTDSWFNPEAEREAAEALLDEGADVIAQHQNTTEPQKAAADAGGLSIGYDSDMAQFVGDTVLTSCVWNWGPKYVDIATRILDGSYHSESFWGGLSDGVVGLAPFSDRVPQEVRSKVANIGEGLRSGEWDVFCGPITGANGNLVVAEGYCLTRDELLNMDYFVEGVVGKAPGDAPAGLGEASGPADGSR